jgi:hypothetical protein
MAANYEAMRAGLICNLYDARKHADALRAELESVERDIIATEGAVVVLSTIINSEEVPNE